MIKGISGERLRQRRDELGRFIDLLREVDVRRYLEVGACHGDTFHEVMTALPAGSFGVAVDMPQGPWGKRESETCLRRAVEDLRARGYDAHVVIGNSQADWVKQIVTTRGPYDAALIDGDHRYAGVKADWESYGPLARIVAFHDIDGDGQRSGKHEVEVPRLWREIKPAWRHTEIIGAERGMGIGVLWQ